MEITSLKPSVSSNGIDKVGKTIDISQVDLIWYPYGPWIGTPLKRWCCDGRKFSDFRANLSSISELRSADL